MARPNNEELNSLTEQLESLIISSKALFEELEENNSNFTNSAN